MAFTEKRLGQVQLATTVGTIYTAGAGTTAIVKSVTIANDNASSRTFSLWLVPSGGAVAGSTVMFPNSDIAGTQVIQWDGFQVLGTNSTIQGSASAASSVTVTISGAEIT